MAIGGDISLMELNAPHDRAFPAGGSPDEIEQEVQARFERVAAERERVLGVVDQMRDEAVACLQGLVQVPSVNPSPEWEKPLADHVAGLMRDLGMEVQQIEPAPYRASNLGVLRGTRSDRSMLYYAHLDTVPAGDESEWTYPPFSGHVADGRIWGRGAKDCKLGMAAAIMAIRAIREAGIALAGDVQLVTPCDEERGGYWGIAQMVNQGMIRADYAIYGEGSPHTVTIGHRGNINVDITTRGKTAHTASKHLGQNALVQMCRLAPIIDSLEYRDWEPHPIVPGDVVGSVNIIRAGSTENTVPDRCTITVDVRFPPGITPQSIVGQIEDAVARAQEHDPAIGEVSVELRRYSRASFIPPDLPIVRYMQRAMSEVFGQEPKAVGMAATSDSRWLVLDAGIPTVSFSMGNDSGHRPNEWAGIQDLIDTTKVYASMALVLLRD